MYSIIQNPADRVPIHVKFKATELFINKYVISEKYPDDLRPLRGSVQDTKIQRKGLVRKMAKIEECFGYKEMWFAVKGADIDTILSCCPELKYVREICWKDASAERTEKWRSRVMLSGPYDGWVFVIGNALWDLSQVDEIVEAMGRIGERAQEVCCFASHRVSDGYGFAKAVQNKIVRLYFYGDGQLFGCMGERSDAEKKLALNYAEREEDLFEEKFNWIGEEDVLNIAGEWSINLQMLLGREEARTVLADRIN